MALYNGRHVDINSVGPDTPGTASVRTLEGNSITVPKTALVLTDDELKLMTDKDNENLKNKPPYRTVKSEQDKEAKAAVAAKQAEEDKAEAATAATQA